MKNLSLLAAAPLTLLTACGLHIEVDGTSEAAQPVSGAASTPVAIDADRWTAEQVFDAEDDPLEAVTTVGGKRTGTWRFELGDEIESLTYGVIGSGGARASSTTNLQGIDVVELTLELQDVNATDLLEQLDGLGAAVEASLELEASLGATDAVRYKLTVVHGAGDWFEEPERDGVERGRSRHGAGSVSTSGLLPGATRDAAVWSGSTRTAVGSMVGRIGEPKVLAAEHWSAADGSRSSPRVRRLPGGNFDATFEINGERQTLIESSTPAWILFVVAE